MPTDHEFITRDEKTQCPVHLTSVKVQGNLPHCSHKKVESRNTFRQKACLQDFTEKENVKLSSGSLLRELRNLFLKEKEIIYAQKQNLKS